MRRKTDLYGFQQRGATELYEHAEKSGVIGMGGGKTVMALTAIRELIDDGFIRQALVLAPKKVAQLVWPAEPAKWEHTAGMGVAVGVGSPAVRKAALFAPVEIAVQTHDNVKWLVEELLKLPPDHPLFDLLIIDEGSRFRNPKSKRAKDLMKVRGRFRNCWELVGTPRPNGYEDRFTPLKIVTNGKLWGKSFYQWRDQNFFPIDWNGYEWSILPSARATIRADIARMSFTVGPDEMPELPEMIDDERTITMVDLPPDARREYDRMLKHLIARWGGVTKLAANAAVASGQLEQIAQGFLYDDSQADNEVMTHILHDEKLDALDDLVESLAGDPLIACYWYKADLARLEGRFGPLPAINSSTKDIVRTVAEFKTGKVPVLLLQPASGGHGLDGLQDSCSQMVWYTPIWSKELYDQTRKRVHRPGQARRTFIHTIMARGTVDEAKRSRVTEGLGEADAFLRYLAEMERLK